MRINISIDAGSYSMRTGVAVAAALEPVLAKFCELNEDGMDELRGEVFEIFDCNGIAIGNVRVTRGK